MATGIGAAAVAAATLAAGATLGHASLLFALRRREAAGGEQPWWFGYARDGSNLSSLGLLWAAMVLAGWGGPAGLVMAVGVAFATYTLDAALGRFAPAAASRTLVGMIMVPLAIATALCRPIWRPAVTQLLDAVLPP